MIALDRASPIPGSASSSATLAELMSSGCALVAFMTPEVVPLDPGGAFGMAVVARGGIPGAGLVEVPGDVAVGDVAVWAHPATGPMGSDRAAVTSVTATRLANFTFDLPGQ